MMQTAAGVHLATTRTHLQASFVGVVIRVAPSSANAPMATLQAARFLVAIVASNRLDLASAALAKEKIQFCIPECAACLSAVAHLCTSSFC